MPGDWIKMRSELQTHPKSVRILSATCTDKFRVVGGLHAVWSVFDAHSVDGILVGYTPELMDHIIGWEGFAQAMIDVGWLEYDGSNCLIIPEFQEHNGQSAKRRAEDQKRKRNVRKTSAKRPQPVRKKSDEMRTREREENIKESTKKKRTPKQKTSLPDNFTISDEVRTWASKHNHSRLDEHLESFKLKCEASGYKYVNWDRAFQNAVREDWAKLNSQPHLRAVPDEPYGAGGI